jgi:hypothetical protein
MRQFEVEVMRRKCGRVRKEVTGVWTPLHKEGCHSSYFSQNGDQIKEIGTGGHVARRGRRDTGRDFSRRTFRKEINWKT